MNRIAITLGIITIIVFASCSKGGGDTPAPAPPTPASFSFMALRVNGAYDGFTYYNTNYTPVVKFSFSTKINVSSASSAITFIKANGAAVPFNATLENGDSTVVIQPTAALTPLTQYSVAVATTLQSQAKGNLQSGIDIKLITQIDSTNKFSTITDDALLTLVQQQTFKYFWDFGHPTSGLARERNTSGDLVTSGGSGFGVMAILAGINRGFITKAEGLARIQKIVGFLKNNAQRRHGAFSHWLNGVTGAIIPFSTKDNGADLVETSYMVMGLLCARQYFNAADATETTLRNDINAIWNDVEWDWFRKGSENVLYWHWSPDFNWEMNLPIRGWNEGLITYILAASSTTHTIPKTVYENGFARNGGIKNGNTYYGVQLPLGPASGGPLFLAQYTFMGVNPTGLSDQYADYWTQNKNHTLINYNYSVANPQKFFGYSDEVWGLTASDIPNGYTASSPTNDVGVIAPTAALSSFPYTPTESMKALKFFYYTLGDKLWKEYGFVDAFSLKDLWFANSFLAIDQGPIIVMIENHRSGLLWNLFTSCPEVKAGMTKLGFTAPYL